MKINSLKFAVLLGVALMVGILACGGGGGGSSPSANDTPSGETNIRGTAAVGRPISNSTIVVKGKDGNVTLSTTDSLGNFDVDARNIQTPAIIQTNANGQVFYSIASQKGITNISPITNLVVRNWFSARGHNITQVFGSTGTISSIPDFDSLNTIAIVYRQILAGMLRATGVEPSSFNFFNTPFAANSQGIDRVFDQTKVQIDESNGRFRIDAVDPETGLESTLVDFMANTDVTQTDTTPPGQPRNFQAVGLGNTAIMLVWAVSTDNVGISGYNIYRNNTLLTTTSYLVYKDQSVVAGTQYCYQVEAVDASGNKSIKTEQSCATAGGTAQDTTAPDAPTGLTAQAAGIGKVDLQWTAATDNIGVMGYNVYQGSTVLASVTSTNYNATGLSANTRYCYTITAKDAAGNESAHSAQVCATTAMDTDTTPPTMPTNLVATAASSSQVGLTWTASTDNRSVSSYNVYRNGARIATSFNLSYTDQGLTSSTQYCYQVAALDAAGNESTKSSQSCATTHASADVTAPSVPASLSATAASSSQINLSWSASTDNVGVSGYKVYRDGAFLKQVSNISTSDSGLAPSTRYCYEVLAIDMAGNESSVGNQACATTSAAPDVTSPSIPTNLTATPASTSQINLNWNPSTDNVGVTGYKVYRGGTYLKQVSGTSTSDAGLSASTQYCYQVSAIDSAGNESAMSSQVCATTQAFVDTTAPSAPTNLAANASSSSQINLTWNASTDNVGVTGYKVYRGGTYLKQVSGTSTSDAGLNTSTQYCYQVSAIDAAGNESAKSSQACATTNASETVVDGATGLMWQKEDDDIARSWTNAGMYCDGLALDGYTDWRLPDIKELESINDSGKYNPAINTTLFPNTKSSPYWSSTTYAHDSSSAWFDNSIDGSVGYYYMSSVYYVRCVRGSGNITPGLMWQQAEGGAMTWANALTYCDSLSLSGYSDWRLPSKRELMSIVDYSSWSPSIDTSYFPNANASFYWSSTTYFHDTSNAWIVTFESGGISQYGNTHTSYVRCVRGGQ